MSSSVETLVNREYKYGFVTDIEVRCRAEGAERGHHPADLGQEAGACVPARVAAQGAIAAGSR